MVQKIYSKIHPVSCTNTHHDITDLVNHGIVKNTKTRISQKQNLLFLRNKTILNFLKNIKTQISQKQNLLFLRNKKILNLILNWLR